MSEAEHDAADDLNQLMSNWRRLTSPTTNENTQTVIHRTEGPSWVMGMVLGVAIATCVATWFGMIIIYDDIRDLKAWSQVHNNEISALKAHQGDK